MSAPWSEYLALLSKLGNTLEELTGVEQRKTQAAGMGDRMTVEDCMKREQAISLSLRSLDKKREEFLAQLGLAGQPLSRLAEHAPAEQELETKAAVETLQRKYALFQAASQVARNTLECNLRAIERLQAEGEEHPEGPSSASRADFRV